jgi:hypothetical protein
LGARPVVFGARFPNFSRSLPALAVLTRSGWTKRTFNPATLADGTVTTDSVELPTGD